MLERPGSGSQPSQQDGGQKEDVGEIIGIIGGTIYVLDHLWTDHVGVRGAFVKDLRPVSRQEYDYRLSQAGRRERFEALWREDFKHGTTALTLDAYLDTMSLESIIPDVALEYDAAVRAEFPKYADRETFPLIEWIGETDGYEPLLFTKFESVRRCVLARLVEHVQQSPALSVVRGGLADRVAG